MSDTEPIDDLIDSEVMLEVGIEFIMESLTKIESLPPDEFKEWFVESAATYIDFVFTEE